MLRSLSAFNFSYLLNRSGVKFTSSAGILCNPINSNNRSMLLSVVASYTGVLQPWILKCNGCQNLIYWDFNITCATCWFFQWVLLITKTVRHLTTPCKSRVLIIFFWCHDAIVAQLFAPNHCFLAKITVTCHRAFSLLKIILNMWELHYSQKKLQ